MLRIFTFFLTFTLFYTIAFSQCLNDVIDAEFQYPYEQLHIGETGN